MTDPDPQPVDEPGDSFEDEVHTRTQALTRRIFDYADEVMRSGSARTKNDFIRQVYPSLVRNLRPDAEDDELAEIKEAQRRLFEKLADADPGELPPRPAVPDVPTDGSDIRPTDPLPLPPRT